jgi:hypothetical protein
MSSCTVRFIAPRIVASCAVLLALAACERGAEQRSNNDAELELGWARAALERNPRVEVVASDAAARVFTIRDRQSGEVQIVRLDEIAAAPVGQLQSSTAPATPPTAASAPDETASTEPSVASVQDREPSTPSPAAAEQPTQQTAAAPPAQSTSAEAGYTIERTQGQLRVTGPGVSIVSSGSPSGGAQANGAQRASEPVICEGRRMVHFDNRDIHVDGNAITVRDGCEMFITNSRIVASGTGVTVRNAVVHVSNSHIEGAAGSFDADADSKMYVRGSTFQGLSRRDELAMVQDQGGNRWR